MSAWLRGLLSCYQLIFSVPVFKMQSKGLGWDALERLSHLSHYVYIFYYTTLFSRLAKKQHKPH